MPPSLTALPDRRRRLSDGALVQATIRARLLGVQFLTLDTTLVIAPADVGPVAGAPVRRPPRPASRRPFDGRGAIRSPTAGDGLSQAIRTLDAGAELLARSRRDGAPRDTPRA